MNIRANLIKLRREAGYTQKKFGERLGYSKTHISNIETCKADPSFGFMEDVEKFCKEENIIIEDMWEVFKKTN